MYVYLFMRLKFLFVIFLSERKKSISKNGGEICEFFIVLGLLRLQQLYQSLQPGNATFHISNVKRVANASSVISFLRALERLDRWSNKYVVLDSTTKLAKDVLISHVRDVQLGRRNYHYFLSGLVCHYFILFKYS